MITNPVKETLQQGRVALGTMVMEFTVPSIAAIAGVAGAEFVLYDMEHTALSTERFALLAATTKGAGLVPIVRVPKADYQLLSRPLEVGALGLMLPCVESAAQAQAAVTATKYPPMGRRGTAFGIAHDGYERGDPVEKMRLANQHTLLIAQIESEAGVANADAIASVDGIDVLWIGHNDLTTSLGIPGQFDHPRYRQALEEVIAACRRHGKYGGFRPDSVAHTLEVAAQGFTCLAFLSDIAAYRTTLSQGLTDIRSALEEGTG